VLAFFDWDLLRTSAPQKVDIKSNLLELFKNYLASEHQLRKLLEKHLIHYEKKLSRRLSLLTFIVKEVSIFIILSSLSLSPFLLSCCHRNWVVKFFAKLHFQPKGSYARQPPLFSPQKPTSFVKVSIPQGILFMPLLWLPCIKRHSVCPTHFFILSHHFTSLRVPNLCTKTWHHPLRQNWHRAGSRPTLWYLQKNSALRAGRRSTETRIRLGVIRPSETFAGTVAREFHQQLMQRKKQCSFDLWMLTLR